MIAPNRKVIAEQTAARCQKHFEELLEHYTGLAMQAALEESPCEDWDEIKSDNCVRIAEKVANAVIERESEITW